MSRELRFAIAAAASIVSGCSTDGSGGPLGIVAFDKTRHVAAAEPLFALGEDRCFDSPAFLMSLMSKEGGAREGDKSAAATGVGPFWNLPVCNQLRIWVRASMPFEGWGAGGLDAEPPYSKWQRNEVIDAMLTSSNRKCGRYVAFLQTYDANINNGLGIFSLASAGLATVLGGVQTAKALAGTSAFFNGARGTLNETHFRDRSVAILAMAFDAARADQRRAITNAQQCEPEQYSMMRGLEDAFRYHSTCSITSGFDEAARAVQRSSAPDLETMKKYIADLRSVRKEMALFVNAGTQTANQPPDDKKGEGSGTKQIAAQTSDKPGSTDNKNGGTDPNPTAPVCPFKTAAATG